MNIEYLILLIVIIISILLVFKNSYENFSLLKLNEANFRTIGSDGKVYNVTDADRLKMAKKLLNLIVTNDKSVDFVKNLYLKSLPKGSIIIWRGPKIPTGWVFCDGKNGTPDLRNRIPVGRGTKTAQVKAGKQGGQLKYISEGGHVHGFTLSTNELPSHGHTATVRTTNDGNHSHGLVKTDNKPLGYDTCTAGLGLDWIHKHKAYDFVSEAGNFGAKSAKYSQYPHSHGTSWSSNVKVYGANDANITINHTGAGKEKKFTIKMPQYVSAYFIQKIN